MFDLISAIASRLWSAFNRALRDAATGIRTRDTGKIFFSLCRAVLLVILCVGGVIGFTALLMHYTDIAIVISLIIWGVYELANQKPSQTPSPTSPEPLVAAEAEEVHEPLRGLVYTAAVEAAENTPLHRPLEEYSIESSRSKGFRLEDSNAIHHFELDVNTPVDRLTIDRIIDELQRQINKHATRFPLVVHDGHAPFVYDIKDNGNFLVVEVVLYSNGIKDKVNAKKLARANRRQKVADIHDCDF